MSFPNILLLSVIAATFPTLFYAALIYWVDRYEKEPIWLLIAAFVWGAVPRILLAFLLSSLLSAPIYAYTDTETADALAGTFIAPAVEESIKGLALLALFFFWQNEIDSPLDGIIYGAMVGMGFAMIENVAYFITVFEEGGLQAWGINVFLRAFIFGLNHAMFTSMTGLGIAVARLAPSRFITIVAPVLGWSAAVFLHFAHNISVFFGSMFFFVALITDWGGIWLTVAIIVWALAQERRWIKRYLLAEVEAGTLTRKQYRRSQSALRRTRHRYTELFSRGFIAFLTTRDFYHRCSELAYKKHHFGLFRDKGTANRILGLRSEVKRLSQKLTV